METMQRAQLFDNGEYIVIYVDMNTYLEKEVHKYIYSEFFLIIFTNFGQWDTEITNYPQSDRFSN